MFAGSISVLLRRMSSLVAYTTQDHLSKKWYHPEKTEPSYISCQSRQPLTDMSTAQAWGFLLGLF